MVRSSSRTIGWNSDLDLAALERAAQVALEREAVAALGAHRRPEHLDAVAAEALGMGHGDLGVLQHLLALAPRPADRSGARPTEAVRKISRSAKVIGVATARRTMSAKPMMRSGSRSEIRMMANSSPAMRASVSCGRSRRPRRRDSVSRIESPAERPTESLTCLKRSISMTMHGRPEPLVLRREGERRLEPVVEQLAVRQAGQVVVHGVVQQALLGGLGLGDVGERADDADDLAVRADHRPRLEAEPVIGAARRAQAEIVDDAAAPLLDHGVERGAVAVDVEGMEQRRASPRPSLRARRA